MWAGQDKHALDDSSAFQGSPSQGLLDKEASQKLISSIPASRVWLRTGFILLSEFCERLVFYSINANLVLFLTNQMNLSRAAANIITFLWLGCSYMTPLIGGWVADTFWGRYRTIVMFNLFYILALIALAVGALPQVSSSQPWVAYLALFVVTIGTGGVKSNIVTFGADQFIDFKESDERRAAMKQTFFNWFYFSINAGAILAFTVIAYVQQEINFTYGLMIPAIVMFIGTFFLIGGSGFYVKLPAAGSIIVPAFKIFWHALKAPWEHRMNAKTLLDRAKFAVDYSGARRFSDEEVENLKSFARLLPIMSTFIVFWLLYSQMAGLFFTQGMGMDLHIIGNLKEEIPVTSLHVFNVIAIIFLVPLFDRLVYPLLRRWNISFGMLKRIGVGMFIISLGMAYAGGLEMYRLNLYHQGYTIHQKIGDRNYTAVPLSILWQGPSYFLIGIGEVLGAITGLEFAYDQAPPPMRSMVMSVFYLTQALGGYVGAAIVGIVDAATNPPWIQDDVNESNLDLYFFVLFGIGILNFLLYVFVASRYQLQSHREEAQGPRQVPRDDRSSVQLDDSDA